MNDADAIQQVINRYSEGASRFDWEQILATYAPDGVWEIPIFGARLVGREAIRAGLIRFSAGTDYIVQMNAPAVIEVTGDTATARSVIRECGRYTGKNELLEVLGSYADRLVRTPEGWRFALRVMNVRGMHTLSMTPLGAR